MNTVALFFGGPLDGRDDIVLRLDDWGLPPSYYEARGGSVSGPLTEDATLTVVKHSYRLKGFVGPLARYDYVGEGLLEG